MDLRPKHKYNEVCINHCRFFSLSICCTQYFWHIFEVMLDTLATAGTLGRVGTLGRHCAVGTLASVPLFAQRDSSCLPVSSYCHGISNILYFFLSYKSSLRYQGCKTQLLFHSARRHNDTKTPDHKNDCT